MARINLLPWRAELRKERQRQFASACGLSAVLGLCVVGLMHMMNQNWIEYQESRNSYLDSEIALLDKRIEEIKTLEKEKQRMIDRMHAIENLQISRPAVVHIFDELVVHLPEGVYLTELDQKGADLTIKGVAESNARVSTFMRNLETSPWMVRPSLDIIETKAEDGHRISNFTLRVKQVDKATSEPKTGAKGKVS